MKKKIFLVCFATFLFGIVACGKKGNETNELTKIPLVATPEMREAPSPTPTVAVTKNLTPSVILESTPITTPTKIIEVISSRPTSTPVPSPTMPIPWPSEQVEPEFRDDGKKLISNDANHFGSKYMCSFLRKYYDVNKDGFLSNAERNRLLLMGLDIDTFAKELEDDELDKVSYDETFFASFPNLTYFACPIADKIIIKNHEKLQTLVTIGEFGRVNEIVIDQCPEFQYADLHWVRGNVTITNVKQGLVGILYPGERDGDKRRDVLGKYTLDANVYLYQVLPIEYEESETCLSDLLENVDLVWMNCAKDIIGYKKEDVVPDLLGIDLLETELKDRFTSVVDKAIISDVKNFEALCYSPNNGVYGEITAIVEIKTNDGEVVEKEMTFEGFVTQDHKVELFESNDYKTRFCDFQFWRFYGYSVDEYLRDMEEITGNIRLAYRFGNSNSFRYYLSENVDSDGNGILNRQERENVTEIHFNSADHDSMNSGYNQTLIDLNLFPNLTSITIEGSASIVCTGHTNLKNITVTDGKTKNVEISDCDKLEKLEINELIPNGMVLVTNCNNLKEIVVKKATDNNILDLVNTPNAHIIINGK